MILTILVVYVGSMSRIYPRIFVPSTVTFSFYPHHISYSITLNNICWIMTSNACHHCHSGYINEASFLYIESGLHIRNIPNLPSASSSSQSCMFSYRKVPKSRTKSLGKGAIHLSFTIFSFKILDIF